MRDEFKIHLDIKKLNSIHKIRVQLGDTHMVESKRIKKIIRKRVE